MRFGVFEVDLRSGELRKQGAKVRLPHQSFQVLAALLSRPGEVVTREELRRLLWPDDTFVDFEMGLSSAVSKVREALGDSASGPRYIETIPRRGYRFIAPLAPPSATMSPAPAPARTHRGQTAALIVAAAIGAAAMWAFTSNRSSPRPTGAALRSLAVLPLDNLTGDPAQEFFVDGITDALITELAQLADVRVISRTSVMQFKGVRKPLPAIAGELHVDGIIEGAVVRSGRRVRISTQLIDGRSDRHLWASSFERDVDGIFGLQPEIARAVAIAAGSRLTVNRPKPPLVDAQAGEFYMRAAVTAGRQTFEGFTDAIAYAQRAVEIQPDFAMAHAAISLWYLQLAFAGRLPPSEFMPKAEAAARLALELDDSLPHAHADLGLVLYRYHWNWIAAERELRRAVSLGPSYANGHRMLSALLSDTGRADEAIAEARRAQELDPFSVTALLNLAMALEAAGRREEALAAFRQSAEKAPNQTQMRMNLGGALLNTDATAAVRELETAVSLAPGNARVRTYLAYAYARTRDVLRARSLAADFERLAQEQYVPATGVAAIYEGLGDRNKALAWLERAVQVRDSDLAGAATDRRFATLRSDPRFRDVMRRIGLPR